MPSFDVVSEVDMHEVTNAVDQANREVGTRFDFKGSNAHYDRKEAEITLQAQVEFQLKQMLEILKDKLARRGVDVACLEVKDAETSLNQARQQVVLRQGMDSALARDIVKRIKDAKHKVQVAIQGDKVRVTSKKKADLLEVIALIRRAVWTRRSVQWRSGLILLPAEYGSQRHHRPSCHLHCFSILPTKRITSMR